MVVHANDINLILGPCPFRSIPSSVDELERLKRRAGLERAVASGFRSLLYYDTLSGLDEDMVHYGPLRTWLSFYATINPRFPQMEKGVRRAAADERIAAVRLLPSLHHYALDAPEVDDAMAAARAEGVPVNLMARIFDDRVAPQYVQQRVPDPEQVAAFLMRHSDVKIALSMFYFSEIRTLNLDWHALPHVYVDFGCSKPNVASLDVLERAFPIGRALFGTGAPFYYWAGSRLGLEGAELSAESKRAIMVDNARDFFSWD